MRSLKERLGSEWFDILNPVFDSPEMKKLATRLSQEKNVEPAPQDWFRAFEYCQPSKIKVCLIAQDPYAAGYAHGLAFSTIKEITPSLQVIFNELHLEYGVMRKKTDLTDWAKQGVLLLNTILTTRYKEPLAHEGWGWESFISAVFHAIIHLVPQPYVVMAWGKYAKTVARNYLLDAPMILDACHPQAENYGSSKFTGCGHFKQANEFLISNNINPIRWI